MATQGIVCRKEVFDAALDYSYGDKAFLRQGTVPGKAGLARSSLDTEEAATAASAAAPRLAAAMIGDRNDPLAELCLLERKAVTALEACELMKAIHFYTDLIKKLESLDDEKTYWMWLARANLGMSDTRLRLGGVQEADEWLQSALELVMAMQSEDPAESSRADVRLFFHQSDVERMSKKGKFLLAGERKNLIQERLLWADLKVQEAAVLVARTTENGNNLYFKALEILLSVASVLQDVLGPESSKVAAALRNAGEVQALRGRFRDALDIYKRALRIETRATGYDGYAVWVRGRIALCAIILMYSWCSAVLCLLAMKLAHRLFTWCTFVYRHILASLTCSIAWPRSTSCLESIQKLWGC